VRYVSRIAANLFRFDQTFSSAALVAEISAT